MGGDQWIYGWCEIFVFSRHDARLESKWRWAASKFHRNPVNLQCELRRLLRGRTWNSHQEDGMSQLFGGRMNFTLSENRFSEWSISALISNCLIGGCAAQIPIARRKALIIWQIKWLPFVIHRIFRFQIPILLLLFVLLSVACGILIWIEYERSTILRWSRNYQSFAEIVLEWKLRTKLKFLEDPVHTVWSARLWLNTEPSMWAFRCCLHWLRNDCREFGSKCTSIRHPQTRKSNEMHLDVWNAVEGGWRLGNGERRSSDWLNGRNLLHASACLEFDFDFNHVVVWWSLLGNRQGDYNRNDPNELQSYEFRVDIDWHWTRKILFIEEPIHLQPNQVLELWSHVVWCSCASSLWKFEHRLNWVTVNFVAFHKCETAVCVRLSKSNGQIVWHRNCLTAELPTNQKPIKIVAAAR